jgi:hypothetical protein
MTKPRIQDIGVLGGRTTVTNYNNSGRILK